MDQDQDTAAIIARIEERLTATGLSAHAASMAAFGNQSGIVNLRKTRNPGLATLAKLAPVLETSASWLAFGIGSPAMAEGSPRAASRGVTLGRRLGRGVPIIGRVAAGAWLETGAHVDTPTYSGPEIPPDPEWPAEWQFALIVQGTSINRVAQDGDVLGCVDTRRMNYRPRPGDLVIAERVRGDGAEVEHTAKRIRYDADGRPTLWPDSTDPEHQAAVEMTSDDGDESVHVSVIGLVTYMHAAVRRQVLPPA